jgi:hypothetical protein
MTRETSTRAAPQSRRSRASLFWTCLARNWAIWGSYFLGQLLPRHAGFDHQPLVALVVDQEMAMEEDAAVFFEMRAGDGLAPRMFGIEGRGPEDDVFAVESAIALANGHGGLVRVVPHGGEAIRFGIETGDSGAGGLRTVFIEEGEVGLQKLAVLDHELLAGTFRDARLSLHGEEGLDDVPVACKLREQLLAGARSVRGLVLIVGLLRDGGSGRYQRDDNPFPHCSHGAR